jgi:hypothetical protein
MSDLPQDDQDPSTATMHPALQAFQDAIPESAAEAPWAQEVTTRLNDWVQRRDMADANEAAANQYTANIGDFKSGLVNMVTADPTAHGVALDIVDPTLHQLMPYDWMDPSKHDETHSALSDDIKYQIAHASVASMARRDGDAARSLMDSPAIAEHLDDQDKAGLSGYIQAHEVARGADAAAGQREATIAQTRQAIATTHGYLSALSNPDTGQLSFPPGYAQKITDDPNLLPSDRGALMHLYGRLQANGDAPRSDAFTVHNTVQAIADGSADRAGILERGGVDLTAGDTAFLHGLTATESEQGRSGNKQLADTLTQAQDRIIGRDGEYGAAGAQAYQRFMDWFMPAYRTAGPQSLDPQHESFLFNGTNINSFRPTGNDLVAEYVNPHEMGGPGVIPSFAGKNPDTRGDANYSRPPVPMRPTGGFTGKVALRDIFGGARV